MTADEIRVALRRHYGLAAIDTGTEEWTVHDEVGIARWGGVTIDILAVRAWGGKPKGHERHAIEIKISRGDFARELRSGKWQAWAEVAHRFYFAAPTGLIRLDEIPPGTGLITVDGKGCRRLADPPRRTPEPLDEAVWIELARRASRLAERLRRPDDPAAELAALQIEHRRLTTNAASNRESIRLYRDRLATLIAAIPDLDVVCSDCLAAMTFRNDPRVQGRRHSLWRWLHVDDPARYCSGQPVPRDLVAAAVTT